MKFVFKSAKESENFASVRFRDANNSIAAESGLEVSVLFRQSWYITVRSKGNEFPLKAHVHPSGFARLSFCFGRVHLLNAVF